MVWEAREELCCGGTSVEQCTEMTLINGSPKPASAANCQTEKSSRHTLFLCVNEISVEPLFAQLPVKCVGIGFIALLQL